MAENNTRAWMAVLTKGSAALKKKLTAKHGDKPEFQRLLKSTGQDKETWYKMHQKKQARLRGEDPASKEKERKQIGLKAWGATKGTRMGGEEGGGLTTDAPKTGKAVVGQYAGAGPVKTLSVAEYMKQKEEEQRREKAKAILAARKEMKEESEQIDELSKSTLRSYRGAAKGELVFGKKYPFFGKKATKRREGIARATKKIGDEKTYQFDEGVVKKLNKRAKRLIMGMKGREKLGPVSKDLTWQQNVAQAVKAGRKMNEEMQHIVGVTVSEPSLKSAEPMLKKVRVKASSEQEAIKKAKSHYRKYGFKVHDAYHHSTITTIKKAGQMSEEYVIHKGKHEPGRVSSLGGQTLHGVTVKDVYKDKKEAQAHADAINKGRGYKPGDEKNSLYGGVLYQVSPRKSMQEEAEQMDEKLERDGPVRQSFDKFQFTIPRSDAAQKYSEKKVKERDAMNKANDPGADKKGYALSVLDRDKAIIKGYKKGVKNPVTQAVVGRKGFKEEVEQMDEVLDTVEKRNKYLDAAMVSAEKHASKVRTWRQAPSTASDKAAKKVANRAAGVERVVKKIIAKEEAEQIDELKRDTLISYVGKARAKNIKDSAKNRLAGIETSLSDMDKASAKVRKRSKGISRAYDRLNKIAESLGKDAPFEGPYRKVGEPRKDEYGNVVKNRAKFLAKKALAAQEKKKKEKIEEAAKWRSTAVAKKITDPGSMDTHSYDYHNDNPLSSGMKRATSDTETPDYNKRRRAEVSTQGPRKGMATRRHIERLKDKIRGKQIYGDKSKPNLPEEVEKMDENNLALRGLVSANPQSMPNYAYKTTKGKAAAAKKNVTALKANIKSALGKHPKPNLPEEMTVDEGSYMGKGNHKPGWMLRADPELARKFKEIEQRRATKAKWAGKSLPPKEKTDEAVDLTKKLTKAIEKKTGGKKTTYRDKQGLLKLKNMKEAKLDKVGKETADIDNDKDVDKTDMYLHNRRDAVKKAILKKKLNEGKAAAAADKAIALKRGKGNKINRKPTMEVDLKAQQSVEPTHSDEDNSANVKV